ncbi:MAG: hypothetical protein IGS39_21370 [Calothrix sp. C42_A2020_038]|nr:hypothetical protein [Calothrix sp. C42_A2020_038]
MWDSEYGCAPFILKTTDIPADILVRLRSNLFLWTAPPEYSGKVAKPVINSWRQNAAPWTKAVRAGEIESRNLITNQANV